MHLAEMEKSMHEHAFGAPDRRAERRTTWVIVLTAVTMVAEIGVGWLSGSMALLADGWHMGTHMFALGIAVFAYRFARRHRDNPSFTFGTGKVASLAGFASSIILGVVALGMIGESVSRFLNPTEIHVREAFIVACLGLLVNLVSAVMLHPPGASDHGHGGEAHGAHHHQDHNLRAAFIHVVTDALTSVLAMTALLAVHFYGLQWMDPAIGLLGAGVIAVWAFGLMRDAGKTLLDAGVDAATLDRVRERLESDSDNRLADLHVWTLGGGALSVAASVVTHDPRPPAHYKALLEDVPDVAHATIEVVPCEDDACIAAAQESAGQAPAEDDRG